LDRLEVFTNMRRSSRGKDLIQSRTGSLPAALRKNATAKIGSLPFISG
jgi:hypothetical protein